MHEGSCKYIWRNEGRYKYILTLDMAYGMVGVGSSLVRRYNTRENHKQAKRKSKK